MTELNDKEKILLLRRALEDLAEHHHRTIENSGYHDPERIDSFRGCECYTCVRSNAVLKVTRIPIGEI